MHETISQPSTDTDLTAAQAADVIRYYHDGENRDTRARGWKDKVSIGRSALRTVRASETILPSGEPILTDQQMNIGLSHIENPPKSDEYYRLLDELSDKQNLPYDEARARLDNMDIK